MRIAKYKVAQRKLNFKGVKLLSKAYDWETDDILKIKIEYDAEHERCLIKIPNSDKEINFNCGDYYEMCECLEEFIQAYIEIRD